MRDNVYVIVSGLHNVRFLPISSNYTIHTFHSRRQLDI